MGDLHTRVPDICSEGMVWRSGSEDSSGHEQQRSRVSQREPASAEGSKSVQRRHSFATMVSPKAGGRGRTWWESIPKSSQTSADPKANILQRCWDECLVLAHDCWGLYRALSCKISVLTVGFWVAITVAGCIISILWNQRLQQSRESDVRKIAESVAHYIESELFGLSVPLFTIGTLVSRSPNVLRLSEFAASYPLDPDNPESWRTVSDPPRELMEEWYEFAGLALGTFSGDIRSAVSYFELAPRGVISVVSGDQEEAIGLDLLRFEPEATAAYNAIRKRTLSAIGPVPLVESEGATGIIVHLPLFVDRAVAGTMDTSLMPDVGVEVVEGKNFWGFISVVINATELLAKSQATQRMTFHDVTFSFSNDVDFSDSTNPSQRTEQVFFPIGAPLVDQGVEVYIRLPNQVWRLGARFDEAGVPPWLWWSIASTSAAGLLVAFLLALLLISNKQNKSLLYRILPKSAVQALSEGRPVLQSFDDATVFFSHLVGFTDLSSRRSALEVVAMLNELYTEFDALATRHRVFKVDTIGDAYMVVGGAPYDPEWECPPVEGAARVARFALEAMELIESMRDRVGGLSLRAGMASGPVVAAVLGTAVPKFSFFGDIVNTASRMDSTGEGGRLQVTMRTRELLEEGAEGLVVVPRSGGVLVKGKGRMHSFWVARMASGLTCESRRGSPSDSQLRGHGSARGGERAAGRGGERTRSLPDLATEHGKALVEELKELRGSQRKGGLEEGGILAAATLEGCGNAEAGGERGERMLEAGLEAVDVADGEGAAGMEGRGRKVEAEEPQKHDHGCNGVCPTKVSMQYIQICAAQAPNLSAHAGT